MAKSFHISVMGAGFNLDVGFGTGGRRKKLSSNATSIVENVQGQVDPRPVVLGLGHIRTAWQQR